MMVHRQVGNLPLDRNRPEYFLFSISWLPLFRNFNLRTCSRTTGTKSKMPIPQRTSALPHFSHTESIYIGVHTEAFRSEATTSRTTNMHIAPQQYFLAGILASGFWSLVFGQSIPAEVTAAGVDLLDASRKSSLWESR